MSPLFGPQSPDKFDMAWSAIADLVAGNSTAETSLMAPSANGARVLPANWLQPGRTVRVILNGVYNAALVPGTLTVKTKLGDSIVTQGDAVALLSLAGAKGFRLATTFTCRKAGATAELTAGGTFEYGTAGNSRQFVDLNSGGVVVVDGTKELTVDVTAQWASLFAANVLTVKTGTVELLV